MTENNPFETIAANVPGIDLWQPRDWPHRRGDEIKLSLHSFPLTADSPGRRSHSCEHCGGPALCIHDNVLCWKCKGTFCLPCTTDPNALMAMPMSEVNKNGFAKCHACNEPLRSIGLIDVFRQMMEMSSSSQDSGLVSVGGLPAMAFGRNNPNQRMAGVGMGIGNGSSIIQEAEDALSRAEASYGSDPEKAILEFTHAINAINYISSASSGAGLVLRAHDVLLIAHARRAQLEGNEELADAICKAYPKASVRSSEGEQTWFLSQTAFKALFYPLPANCMSGSRERGGCVSVDLRTESLDRVFDRPEFQKQVELTGIGSVQNYKALKSVHPHCEGFDALIGGLNGTWRGLYSIQVPKDPSTPLPVVMLGDQSVEIIDMHHFVTVFPTKCAASEYTRLKHHNKRIGEEGPPLNAVLDSDTAKVLKSTAERYGAQGLQRVYVLDGTTSDLHKANGLCILSSIAAVENVFTKVFLVVKGNKTSAAAIAARVIAHVDRQVRELRSTNETSLKESFHHSDLSLCAYCGKDHDDLKTCTRCNLAKYCNTECQRSHYQMKGQFGHKKFCREVFRSASS